MTLGAQPTPWPWVAHGCGLLVAATMGYFLLRIPIQLTDAFTALLALDAPLVDLMRSQFLQEGYLRPFMWAQLKIVHDLSGGEFFLWYRWTHVLQVAVLAALFVRLLQPRTAAGALVIPLALAMLVGGHTFAWTVREAYPINTFLTITICCAVAANLAFGERRWWTDPAAAGLTLAAVLTVESGVLVAVVFVGAYLLGLRAVSRAGIAAVCLAVAGYLVLRFAILDTGLPGLTERDSGFGFARLDASEIDRRFGDAPLPFYAYNVLVSILSVLTAEPRHGVFRLTASVLQGTPSIPLLVSFVSTTLITGLIAVFAWKRRRQWISLELSGDDRLVLLFILVLLANAAISFAYTKDMILSPAGLFHAAAGFVAVRTFVERLPASGIARMAAVGLLAFASVLWSVRAVGLHAGLDWMANRVRSEWAYVGDWVARTHGDRDLPPRTAAAIRFFQDDATVRHPARPQLRDEWVRMFELDE